MSYILDALKKSAEERRRTQATESMPRGSALPVEGTGKTRRTGFILTVMLLCMAGLAGGAWYWQNQFRISAEPIGKAAPPPEPAAAEQTETVSVTTRESPPPDIASTRPPSRPEPKRLPPDEPVTRPAAVPDMDAPRETAAPPLFDDLPEHVKSSIPRIRFSGHVYSPVPTLRMIMADQAIVREHDIIASEMRLEEITETGVLLNFRGTRFRLELLPPLN